MSGSITLFTNDTGAASGTVDYVRDVFDDVTLQPTTNSGLTDTAATNPLSQFFGNTDIPRFGIKTYFIKDLTLVEDRSLWISNKPTYKVIFTESNPNFYAYVFGNIQISYENSLNNLSGKGQIIVTLRDLGDGIGVSGVIRRASFLVNDDTSATATGQLVLDGVNTTTVDFSGLASDSDATPFARYSSYVSGSVNQTVDLHDWRLTALQASTLRLVGITIDQSNGAGTLAAGPGVSYVDKTKVTTSTGSTLSIPSLGSSLGGMVSLYKTQLLGYTAAISSAPIVTSIAQGSSGTNLMTVTTGQGASFRQGGGIVVNQGSSTYVGSILSVSTDTLTVSPTLPFGITNSIYQAWTAGPTYAISATLFQLSSIIDFNQIAGQTNPSLLGPSGITLPIHNLSAPWSVFGNNLGVTTIDNVVSSYFLGASGYLQIEGNFSAARIETVGPGIFNATMSINGLPGWSVNEGQSGMLSRPVFTNAGPGWNRIVIQPGTSMGTVGISKVDLYQYSPYTGITFGLLGSFEVKQAEANRSAINATLSALGTERRIFADQMYLKGGWVRSLDGTAAGGVIYSGASTNSSIRWEWYGKDYAIVGTAGSSAILTLDGVGVGSTFNILQSVATEGFHSLVYQHQSGTCIIQAFDFIRPYGGVNWLGKQARALIPTPISQPIVSEVSLSGGNGYGSTATSIRRYTTTDISTGSAITYVDSATQGGMFLINESGYYSISKCDVDLNGAGNWGISLNISDGSVGILSLPLSTMILNIFSTTAASARGTGNVITYLKRGDIVRSHDNGASANPTTTNQARFRIIKLSGGAF